MRCSKCETEKDIDEFWRIRKGEDKRRYWCIVCMRATYNPSLKAKANRNEYKRKKRAKLRTEALYHYSKGLMKCNCCGESQERFLTLDHINNNGHEDKKRYGRSMLGEVKNQGYPEGYQILCYNCNCGRAHNNGVCPHKEI